MRIHDRLFIGGELVNPAGSEVIEVVSPATEEPVGRTPLATEADVDRAVAAARQAYDEGPWPRMTFAERAEVLGRIADHLRGRTEEIATTITNENGTPMSFSLMGQAFAPIMVFDFYVDLAKKTEIEELRPGMLGNVVVRSEPVGVVGAIVPWNVPLFTTATKLAPALAAGCTVVLKPAPETPLDAYFVAEACIEAGLPPGVVNIVPAGRETGEHLVRHPGVDKIAFTGSTAAGKRIMSICGEQVKRVSLELGGKSAAIILDDADLDAAIPGLMPASLMNTGQACIAATRILASRDRYDEVVERLCATVGAMKLGDPLDPSVELGPLVAERQRDRVESYIRIGQEEGAKIALGGGRPAGFDKGWYVEPTIFVGVDNSMRIAQEEIFGPVLSVIPYDDEADAVRIANDSDYGLSGLVWTTNPAHGLEIARQVRTGTFIVNGYGFDFNGPFGGYKQSGIGRELGAEGMHGYIEQKSVLMPADFTL